MGDTEHLRLEEMPELLSGEDADPLVRVLPHLAAGCPECRTAFQLFLDLQDRWGYWDATVVVHEPAVVEEHLGILLEPDYYEGKAALLHKDSDLPSWCLATRLLELSQEAGSDEKGLELALLGCRTAELLSGPYDPSYVADLQVRLLSRAATLFKHLGEHRAARDYLSRAAVLLDVGTGDPQVAADLLSAKRSPM